MYQVDQWLGWIATILFTAIYFPAIGKYYQRMLAVALIANLIAICYATLIAQPPLQIKYLIAIICILVFKR
jgi:uncharacterized membrane protein